MRTDKPEGKHLLWLVLAAALVLLAAILPAKNESPNNGALSRSALAVGK